TLNVYLNGSWTSLSTAGGTLTGGGATNQLAVWTGANSVGGITAANSAVLVTNSSGVPSLATDIPTAVTIGGAYIYRAGGTDVPVGDGGTGLTALTQYGILYAPTTSTMGQITEITTGGKALVSAVAGAPVFGKVILTQPATGSTLTIVDGKTLTVNNSVTISASNDSSTLNIATGGTLGTAAFTASTAYIATSLMTTVGDLIYGGASGVATRLPGSAVNGTYVLTEVVVASTAVAPVWTATTSLTVAKATNLVGAAWGVPYQSATDTTLFVAQAGTVNHVFISGANNAAPSWTGGTLTLPTSGSLTIPAFAVSFSNAFATTGAFSTSLTQGANLTLTMPAVATANMIYNTSQPVAANYLMYSGGASGLVNYQAFPASLTSVLTQTSAGTLAWAAATVTIGTTSTAIGGTSASLAGIANITHIAGTNSVAPIVLTSGVVLTAPVVGAFEFVTDTLSFTITTGTARKTIAFTDSAMSGTSAKATNLVGAAWGVPYQSATDTTSFLAQAGTVNHVFLSGANNTAPTWSGGTLTLPASGSLSIPAFAVSFANAFAVTGAFSTSLTAGGNTTLTLPIVSGTLATLAGSEAFTNKSYNGMTLTASTGTLTIPNATVAFSAAFATTGAFTTSLTQGANLTLALPPVATANMVYNTAAPGANNQLAYAAASSAALSYITAPAVLSVLTQSSNGAAPAWTTATGTGSPVFGTDPTIAVSTQGKLTASYVPTADNDVTNKLYVDTMSVGLRDFKDSVVAATVNAGNITLAGGAPNSLDGVSLAANNRILVKNQTNAAENGIYYVATLGTGANGTWTRTTDADASTEVTLGLYVFVEGGSAANKGAWVLSSANANPIVLNTTLLTFSKFSNLSDLAAGNGIDITTNTVSVKVNASTTYLQYAIPYFDTTSSINRIALPTVNNQVLLGLTAGAPFFSKLVLTPPATNATITIADTKTFTVNNSLTLAGADAKTINFGSYSFTLVTTKDAVTYNISGTSSSSATQYLPTKYYTTITGTGPHTVTHNLGTKDVTVAVYDNSDNLVVCDVVTTSTTVVTLTWGYGAPGASTFRVVVIG
ncbi:MAG: hypothetical protein JHC33_02685, partial [Ignisphaera sp.]|nr:hypothetical protein [Ignisphaera sp.]